MRPSWDLAGGHWLQNLTSGGPTEPGLCLCCRCNVDMLKLIQLGLTFTDAEGQLPRYGGELCVWQFNFR